MSVSHSQAPCVDFVPTDERPVFLTSAAVQAVKDAISRQGGTQDGLRISIIGGGCAGYQYNLDFEEKARPDDTVMEFEGLRVFLDSVSARQLRGTVLDYVADLHGAGFKFNNPNVRRTCRCSSA